LQTANHEFDKGIKKDKLGSFEDWDTLVRQVVAWVAQINPNYVDPKKSIDESVIQDPENESLAELLEEIVKVRGEEWFEAKHLYADIEFSNTLSDAFFEILRTKQASSKSIGKALSNRRGCIANGRKIIVKQNGKKPLEFRIETGC